MFKAGEVVRLKSGGPKMTAQRLIGDKDKSHPMIATVDEALKLKGGREGDLVCMWFVGTELKSDAFREETLELTTDTRA